MKKWHLALMRTKFCLFFSLTLSIASLAQADQKTFDIKLGYKKGKQYRVQSQLQHSGTVLIDRAGQDKKIKKLPIEVEARLDYYERFVGSQTNLQAIRYFDRSRADIKIADGSTRSELTGKNRLVVARFNPKSGNGMQVASVNDVLKQSELDLLRNPADPLTFAGLLNRKEAKEGMTWKPDRTALARFLAIDQIISSDVKLRIKQVDAHDGKIYLMGSVIGAVDDVETEIRVKAIFLIDFASQHVRQLRVSLDEQRKPGQIAPGFDGRTKIDLKITTGPTTEQLSNKSLSMIARTRKIRQQLRWESPQGDFGMHYDPAWRLIASEREAAVLRYLNDGEMMAQCRILRLGARPASSPLSLEAFKEEIADLLEDEAEGAKVIDAKEMKTAAGLRALQVTVSGLEEGVPLNWIYFNLSTSDGRQATMIFTVEKSISDQVMPAARKMVNGFAFKLQRPTEKRKSSAARDAKSPSSTTHKR